MSCPATGIRDFPIQNSVNVTQTLNDSIYEPSSLEIQWAKQGTVPTFQRNFFSEGIYSSGTQTTTLRFRGTKYNLQTAQLVEPQHKGLVLLADKESVNGEIVLVFESPTALTEKYLFLCIPLLNKSATGYSPYLEGIRQDRLSGRPVGLDDVIPSSKEYISYSTCLRLVEQNKSTPVQAAVLVFWRGLPYPTSQLRDVCRKMKMTPPLNAPPSLETLVQGLIPKSETTLFLISSEEVYKRYLRSSELPSSSSRSTDTGTRTDSTDSYKCVPLKPDETVKDNRILIDTDKGVPLSQVLKEKQEEQGEGKITPGMVERMIAAILGTAIGIFVLSVIAYIFSRVTSETTDTSFPWFMGKVKDLVPMVFVSMVVGIIGFLIGFFTSTT